MDCLNLRKNPKRVQTVQCGLHSSSINDDVTAEDAKKMPFAGALVRLQGNLIQSVEPGRI